MNTNQAVKATSNESAAIPAAKVNEFQEGDMKKFDVNDKERYCQLNVIQTAHGPFKAA